MEYIKTDLRLNNVAVKFCENKYGMFIHWGLYSQCGGVWKGQRMDGEAKGQELRNGLCGASDSARGVCQIG